MLAVNQENEQLMEDYEKLASDVGIPVFPWPQQGPATPPQDKREPQNLYLQIHPWSTFPGWV